MTGRNRLICWGGATGLEGHRHIQRHYQRAAAKMGWPSYIYDDREENRQHIQPGSLVISADIYGRFIGEAIPGVRYVLHNFDASHQLCQTVDPENLLRLQVWTNDAQGTPWGEFRAYDHEARTLFQPWGTDLFSEEFMDPIFNPYSNEVTFVGAIWGEKYNGVEMGNVGTIEKLKLNCADEGLTFRHLTNIPDTANISAVRQARLAPAFAGDWQVDKNYLPCRVFKNISYGVLGITNVPALREYLGLPDLEMEDMFGWALKLKQTKYLALIQKQQRKIFNYSYRESLVHIERALDLGRF